jgi:hypothetical protein
MSRFSWHPSVVLLFLLPVTPSFAQVETPLAEVRLARQAAHRAQAVSPNAIPFLAQPSDMTVTEGFVAEQSVTATDDDGQSLEFFKLDGPDFLSVGTTLPGAGSAMGQVRLRPGYIDAGIAKGTIGVSDGIDGARRRFSVTVSDAARVPSIFWAYLDPTSFTAAEDPGHTAMGDLNGDGISDLVVGHINTGVVSVFLGGGGTAFQWHAQYALFRPQGLGSVTIGDFTGDSRPDLAFTDAYRVWLMAGFGDGTFQAAVPFATGTEPYSSDSGDLNGDGVADLVVGNYNAETVSVLLADGLGHLGAPISYAGGHVPINLELVDLNLDGNLDIAVADAGGGVSILLGDGVGSFGQTQQYPSAPIPYDLAVGDLNGDFLPDIVTAANGRDSVSVLLNTGAGIFQHAGGFHPGHGSTAFSIHDFNADGRADLALVFEGGVQIFSGDGAGGFASGIVGPTILAGSPGASVDATAIDLNADGATDLVWPMRGAGAIAVLLSDPAAGVPLAARAFLSKPGPIQTGGGGPPYTCGLVEPVAGSYENSSVNLSVFVLTSPGTGEVARVPAQRAEMVGDTDRNGAPEVQVCFSRDDLGNLFSRIHGKTLVNVAIEGALNSGRPLLAPLEIKLKSPDPRSARVHPNPSNPAATLTFETERAGSVRVRLFDLSGRLIRTILEEPSMNAGVHSTRIDGLDHAGKPISSGVIFYQVESPQRLERGRIVILR